jgi:hypothetical protein
LQREGEVRSRKGSEQVRSTHFLESTKRENSQDRKESELEKGIYMLESADGRANEDTERKRVREGHLHTAEHKVRDKSGHKKQASE